MITFKTVRYKNLLSSGNQFTEIDLQKHKTTLVVGENGSGKSTIIEAIFFGLFNRPFRNINKPQLVNTINKKNLVVELEFDIGKNSYKIVRGINPTKINPTFCEIFENGKLINQLSDQRDYQTYLEKNILKTNYKTFGQVVILGTASYIPFMQLTTQQRREIVEDLLDLKIFSLMNSLLKTKVQTNAGEINENVTNKKLLNQKLELIKQHSSQQASHNEKMIKDKKDRIKSAEENIKKAEDTVSELWKKKEEFQIQTKDKVKVQELEGQILELQYKIENKVTKLKKDIIFFNNNEHCPTCSQVLTDEFKLYKIAGIQQEHDIAWDALIKIRKKLTKVRERWKEIDKGMQGVLDCTSEIGRLENSISGWKDYIVELQSDIDSIQSNIVSEDQIPQIKEELIKNEDSYNDLSNHKTLLEYAGIMLKDSGIKSKIIKQYIPIINKLINKYLSMLDFFVNFSIDEKFDEKILSRFRDEFTYNSFSEGEKFRINLAILFTWRAIAKLRNSINTNILFMDEIFDSSLDLSGTDEFLKIITTLNEDTNIFIISHKTDVLYDRFQNVLKFEKRNNFSRIVSI